MDLLPGQITQEQSDALDGPPGLLSRAGQQLANAPSDIFNTSSRLLFNLGLQDTNEPAQVPQVYDIPEAKGFAEHAVDFLAGGVSQIPLIMLGEGIVGAGANLLEAGSVVSSMAKGAGGFALLGASDENPIEGAAVGAVAGTVLGAVPGLAKRVLKKKKPLLLPEETIAPEVHKNADLVSPTKDTPVTNVKSAQASADAIIGNNPYVFKPAEESARAILRAEESARPGREMRARVQSLVPQPESAEEAANIFLRSNSDASLLHAESRLDAGGRQLRQKLERESRLASGLPPEEGMLIRRPTFSPEEALAFSREKQGLPLLPRSQPPQITDLEMRKGTNVQPPSGSLLPSARFSEGEAAVSAERSKLLSEPKVATLQPTDRGTTIEGVAVVDKETAQRLKDAGGVIKAEPLDAGPVGTQHKDLMDRAINNPDTFMQMLEAFPEDSTHVFYTDTGTLVDRNVAGDIARQAKQVNAGHSGELRSHHLIARQERIANDLLSKPVVESPKIPKAELEIPKPQKQPKPKVEKPKTIKQQKAEVATLQQTADIPPSSSEKRLNQLRESKQRVDDKIWRSAEGTGDWFKPKGNGEAGAAATEVVSKIFTVATAGALGGVVGAAISDPDHRTSMAIVMAGMFAGLGHITPRMLRALAEANPNITRTGSFPHKIVKAVEAVGEVARASDKVATEVSAKYAQADEVSKITRYMSRQFTTDPQIVLARDRSAGVINDFGHVIQQGQRYLAEVGLTGSQKDSILKLFNGDIDYATFNKTFSGQPEIRAAAAGIHEAFTVMQTIYAESLPEGELRNIVINKFGKYLTDAFKAHHDPRWLPNETKLLAAAQEWTDVTHDSLDVSIAMLRQHAHEIKVNRAIYGRGSAPSGFADSFGSAVSRKDVNIGPAMKDFLGIYDDPLEKIAATADKLTRAARTAGLFNEFEAVVKPNGNKMVYSKRGWTAAKEAVDREIAIAQGAGDVEKVATLQQKRNDLENFMFNPKNIKHGRLSEAMVDRRVHDSLLTFDSIMTHSSSGVLRALSDATNGIKYGKTILNPLQVPRQILQMPIMGLMSRTHPGDWARAFASLHDPTSRQRLEQLGLLMGDQIMGMLKKDTSALLKGRLDHMFSGSKFGRAKNWWEEVWRTPDLVIRVAAFEKEEARLLAEYGPTGASRATDEAIHFANRYTMNYGAIPPGIQTLRKIPFVNQYLSFAFEALRITKNLTEDAVGWNRLTKKFDRPKDVYAMAVLSSIAATPFIIQQMSESLLSPEDKKEWDVVKNLGPSYSRSDFKFVSGKDNKGNFHYVNFTPLVLQDKFSKMMRDINHLDGAAFMADNPIFGWENTPLLTVASNMITGKDIHTGKTLSAGGRLDSIRRDVLPPLLGTDLDKIVLALTPNSEGGLGLRDAQTGQANSIGSILGSYASSLREYTVAPSYVIRRAVVDAQQETANARTYLWKISRSNATLQQKADALAEFKAVQKQIVMKLRDRLRLEPPSQAGSAL